MVVVTGQFQAVTMAPANPGQPTLVMVAEVRVRVRVTPSLTCDVRMMCAMTQTEMARQIKAVKERQKRFAALPRAQAKKEGLKLLIEAGIYTKNGKLSARYRR
jgi:hypothetical protein